MPNESGWGNKPKQTNVMNDFITLVLKYLEATKMLVICQTGHINSVNEANERFTGKMFFWRYHFFNVTATDYENTEQANCFMVPVVRTFGPNEKVKPLHEYPTEIKERDKIICGIQFFPLEYTFVKGNRFLNSFFS